MKPNRNARMQGVRNMLANESLFLQTVDLAIDFWAVAHMHIMPSEVIIVEFASVQVPMFAIWRLTGSWPTTRADCVPSRTLLTRRPMNHNA